MPPGLHPGDAVSVAQKLRPPHAENEQTQGKETAEQGWAPERGRAPGRAGLQRGQIAGERGARNSSLGAGPGEKASLWGLEGSRAGVDSVVGAAI